MVLTTDSSVGADRGKLKTRDFLGLPQLYILYGGLLSEEIHDFCDQLNRQAIVTS